MLVNGQREEGVSLLFRESAAEIYRLFKGKGDMSICGNHRGISTENSTANKHAAYIRNTMLSCSRKHVREGQWGGVSARGTDLAAHAARSIIELSCVRRASVPLLFIDVIDALIRSRVTQSLCAYDDLASFCKASVWRRITCQRCLARVVSHSCR